MWAILALAAAVLTSFNPILYKRLLRQLPPVAVVWGVLLLALPFLAVSTFARTPQVPRLDVVFVAASASSAALNALPHTASTRALKHADASLVTPLLTFGPVFTVLLGWLVLGEQPTARGLVGVLLLLLGAYWLNRRPGTGWLSPLQTIVSTPAVRLVLAAGLLWSITPVLEKIAIGHTVPQNPPFAALTISGLLVLILTPVALVHGRGMAHRLIENRRQWFLAAGIATAAPLLGYTAFSLGPVGYVATLFRLSAIFTVIWGAWLLHEEGLRERLPATIMMVGGALLIAT